MHSKMRRGFSISLVLLFLLTPLASWLPSISESNLPMCCRRNGAHRCAASLETESGPGAAHYLSAPSRCQRYLNPAPATLAAFLLPAPPVAETPQQQPATSFLESKTHQVLLRIASDRGPPSIA